VDHGHGLVVLLDARDASLDVGDGLLLVHPPVLWALLRLGKRGGGWLEEWVKDDDGRWRMGDSKVRGGGIWGGDKKRVQGSFKVHGGRRGGGVRANRPPNLKNHFPSVNSKPISRALLGRRRGMRNSSFESNFLSLVP